MEEYRCIKCGEKTNDNRICCSSYRSDTVKVLSKHLRLKCKHEFIQVGGGIKGWKILCVKCGKVDRKAG